MTHKMTNGNLVLVFVSKFRNIFADRIVKIEDPSLLHLHNCETGKGLCYRSNSENRISVHLFTGFFIPDTPEFFKYSISVTIDDGCRNAAGLKFIHDILNKIFCQNQIRFIYTIHVSTSV